MVQTKYYFRARGGRDPVAVQRGSEFDGVMNVDCGSASPLLPDTGGLRARGRDRSIDRDRDEGGWMELVRDAG